MGTYSRRRTPQFNPSLRDDRRVKDPNLRLRRDLDRSWRAFLAARRAYREGEGSLSEVQAALSKVNRIRRRLYLHEVDIDVGLDLLRGE